MNKKYGLIGRNIEYSFSKNYFERKFQSFNFLDYTYQNFDIDSLSNVEEILKNTSIYGLNVTIPYKESIMKYLDVIDIQAREVKAVNTIYLTEDRKTIGYNTDVYGFEKLLFSQMKTLPSNALILGTGGVSKAVFFVLKKYKVSTTFVSRFPEEKELSYENLEKIDMLKYLLIINCTPLGTFPNINQCPKIPYKKITSRHYLFDLVYNPEETLFLKLGIKKGAKVKNGRLMLEAQAEKSWEIWNKKK